MPVPNPPFWLSVANTEFGANGYASNIMAKAGLSLPAWTTQLAGKSASSHSMLAGSYNNGIATAAGFRSAYDRLDQPQVPFGSITPATFIGELRGVVSSTNTPDKVSLNVKGYVAEGTIIQLTVQGLVSNTKQVTRGGDDNFFCLFDVVGAYNAFLASAQAGTAIKIDLKVV